MSGKHYRRSPSVRSIPHEQNASQDRNKRCVVDCIDHCERQKKSRRDSEFSAHSILLVSSAEEKQSKRRPLEVMSTILLSRADQQILDEDYSRASVCIQLMLLLVEERAPETNGRLLLHPSLPDFHLQKFDRRSPDTLNNNQQIAVMNQDERISFEFT